jgi:hypothetical protein
MIRNNARQKGFAANLNKEDEGSEWTVTCTTDVVPKYRTISRIEDELDQMAYAYGGRIDGWGAFPVQ